MTDWPLICDRCETERYIGILYEGLCPDCHTALTREKLAGMHSEGAGQSALGDFA